MDNSDKNELQQKMDEIESYYDTSLSELVISLSKEPIVRSYTGHYFRVMGVGSRLEMTGESIPTVIYKLLNANDSLSGIYCEELTDFLAPNSDTQNYSQKRRFEIVEQFNTQLDLVDTKDLLDELSKRDTDYTRYLKDDIVDHDFVLARVYKDDNDNQIIHSIYNVYSSLESAKDTKKRLIRSKCISENSHEILERVFIKTK